jgi:hypothetical protein
MPINIYHLKTSILHSHFMFQKINFKFIGSLHEEIFVGISIKKLYDMF